MGPSGAGSASDDGDAAVAGSLAGPSADGTGRMASGGRASDSMTFFSRGRTRSTDSTCQTASASSWPFDF